MKENINTVLLGHRVVLTPYTRENVPVSTSGNNTLSYLTIAR